jgi:polyisoprenyl-phosphate glycosyltransferase
MTRPSSASLVVLVPVLDDWKALSLMLPRLGNVIAPLGLPVGLLIVDDGSLEPGGPDVVAADPRFAWVRVLRLRRNLGHQRAIAVGLCYVEQHISCEAVIVMDGDGEDRPEDVPHLLARMRAQGGSHIVFGERRRRVERLSFRFFYLLYRLLHWMLTGFGVRVGNFSVIPRARLESLVVVSELWVHYAAAVVRSRQPWSAIPVVRDRRLDGASRMNFVALVVHGLGAISVYSDVVFTRVMCATVAVAASTLVALVTLVVVRLSTSLAIPGWTAFATLLLVVLLFQAASLAASLSFVILGAQQQASFTPLRDYGFYVSEAIDLVPVGQSVSSVK